MNSPRITLSNGLTIANFSSPHPFTFEDGTVLPSVSDYDSMRLKVTFTEYMIDQQSNHKTVGLQFTLSVDEKEIPMPKEFQDFVWYDIKLTITIPQHVSEQIVLLNKDTDIDIILVPFMVLKALNKHHNKFAYSYFKKCRVIRVADRVTKEIYPDRFCI